MGRPDCDPRVAGTPKSWMAFTYVHLATKELGQNAPTARKTSTLEETVICAFHSLPHALHTSAHSVFQKTGVPWPLRCCVQAESERVSPRADGVNPGSAPGNCVALGNLPSFSEFAFLRRKTEPIITLGCCCGSLIMSQA